MKYTDKNGRTIKAGSTLKWLDGSTDKVYACGDGDLGVNASNLDYLRVHHDAVQEFYPLYQFDLSTCEVIEG